MKVMIKIITFLLYVVKKSQKYDIIGRVKGGIPMNDKLSREEILHVAELARIKINEEEIEKYQVELKKILNDVEKINNVEGYDDDILISCWNEATSLRKDKESIMLNPKQVIENAPRHSGNYIEVPVVISEEA